jgi:hypothetical protein
VSDLTHANKIAGGTKVDKLNKSGSNRIRVFLPKAQRMVVFRKPKNISTQASKFFANI